MQIYMKKNYLAIVVLTLLSSCNPAAKENERLQNEAKDYIQESKETIKNEEQHSLQDIFPEIEPVEVR